eukprot:303096-Hanusia_phi.AAC.2
MLLFLSGGAGAAMKSSVQRATCTAMSEEGGGRGRGRQEGRGVRMSRLPMLGVRSESPWRRRSSSE